MRLLSQVKLDNQSSELTHLANRQVNQTDLVNCNLINHLNQVKVKKMFVGFFKMIMLSESLKINSGRFGIICE